MIPRCYLIVAVSLSVSAFAAPIRAHDTWLQTNTSLIRTGDAVYIDLRLGNHGNDHRDFKLAGKIDLEGSTLAVVGPDGGSLDILDTAIDTGYAPKEGYWMAKFAPRQPGLYLTAQTRDGLHGTKRTIKSAKTCFVVSPKLDEVDPELSGYDRVLGHALELVPQTNPVTRCGPGMPIDVRLLYQGQPLPNARVSFVPQGTVLSEGFDDRYERMTDVEGRASYTPTEGNYLLIVAHHAAEDQKGEGYDRTAYSATLTVLVPEVCPCCGD